MIDNVTEVDWLYYFEGETIMSGQAQGASSEISFSNEDEIKLKHCWI